MNKSVASTTGTEQELEQELRECREELRLSREELDLGKQRLYTLQLSLVPDKLSTHDSRYKMAYTYSPAIEESAMGGDFYDAFKTKETGFCGLTIGDVCGKGPEAVFLATSARSMIRAFAFESRDCAEALNRTSQTLQSQISERDELSYLTAFLMILEHETGGFCYSNAGHRPAILRRANGTIETLQYGDVPLCVSKSKYHEYRDQLGEGDTIILYTDGLTDLSRKGERFEIEGLIRVISESGALPVTGFLKAILSAAEEWSDRSFKDDIAIVILERTG